MADFLELVLDVLADDYKKIDLANACFNKKYFADEMDILDLTITTKGGHIINVEIQKSNLSDIDKIIGCYLSRLTVYQDQIDNSDPYTKKF